MNNVNNAQVLYHMGGFHLFERSSDETINDNRRIPRIDDELHPLQAIDLVSCDVYKSFTMPTKSSSVSPLSGSKHRGSYCSV